MPSVSVHFSHVWFPTSNVTLINAVLGKHWGTRLFKGLCICLKGIRLKKVCRTMAKSITIIFWSFLICHSTENSIRYSPWFIPWWKKHYCISRVHHYLPIFMLLFCEDWSIVNNIFFIKHCNILFLFHLLIYLFDSFSCRNVSCNYPHFPLQSLNYLNNCLMLGQLGEKLKKSCYRNTQVLGDL